MPPLGSHISLASPGRRSSCGKSKLGARPPTPFVHSWPRVSAAPRALCEPIAKEAPDQVLTCSMGRRANCHDRGRALSTVRNGMIRRSTIDRRSHSNSDPELNPSGKSDHAYITKKDPSRNLLVSCLFQTVLFQWDMVASGDDHGIAADGLSLWLPLLTTSPQRTPRQTAPAVERA
jgi:hypothetical protein